MPFLPNALWALLWSAPPWPDPDDYRAGAGAALSEARLTHVPAEPLGSYPDSAAPVSTPGPLEGGPRRRRGSSVPGPGPPPPPPPPGSSGLRALPPGEAPDRIRGGVNPTRRTPTEPRRPSSLSGPAEPGPAGYLARGGVGEQARAPAGQSPRPFPGSPTALPALGTAPDRAAGKREFSL